MDVDPAIQTYFDADRRGDREALVEAFGPNATVMDEGRTYRGQEAIGAWWTHTKAAYAAMLEPLGASQSDGATVVRARATGKFPGSPAILTFAFRMAGGRIQGLEIRA